jgi:hypothetical protein
LKTLKPLGKLSQQQLKALLDQRGKEAHYSWEQMYLEIAVIGHLDSLPEKQAELMHLMQKWFASKGLYPSESRLKDKLKPLYELIQKNDRWWDDLAD